MSQGDTSYNYSLSLENVSGLYAVGASAFIIADGKYYTLDLSSREATPVLRDVTSPARVNYFNSNGSILIAKAPTGDITVYDGALQEQKEIYNEYITNDVYATGDGVNFYAYTFPGGKPHYDVIDSEGNSTLHTEISYNVRDYMYVGDVLYVNVYSEITDEHGTVTERTNIALANKSTGELISVTDLCPDYFYAYGRTLYAIEDKGGKSIVKVYSLNKTNDGLEQTATISMAGDDAQHLNGPTDVVKFGENTVIADRLNSRLAFIGNDGVMQRISVPSAPVRLAADDKGVYILSEDDGIRYVTNGECRTEVVKAEGSISDIVCLSGMLYALTDGGLYAKIGASLVEVAGGIRGRRIATAKDGNNLYILADDGLTIADSKGNTVSRIAGEFADVKDIMIDYAGDVFALYADRIEKYKNNLSSLELISSTELKNATVDATANSAYLDDEEVTFTAEECFAGRLSVDAADEKDFSNERPTLSAGEYSFARLSSSGHYLPYNCRPEEAHAPINDVLLVLENAAPMDGYKYALLGSELIVVPENALNGVQPTTLTGRYDVIEACTLYTLPYFEDGRIALGAGATLTVLSDCAGYDGNVWDIVQYDGKKYFVSAANLKEHVQINPPSEDKSQVFGRANAGRVGGLVGIYSDDALSNMTVEIVDGTKVEVISQYEDCYLVKYGDVIGYMRSDELKINGLTTVQIVSIVLSIVVLLAGSGIFIAIYLTKQELAKRDNIDYNPED